MKMRKICLHNRYNYKKENGDLLSPNKWFDYVTEFYCGVGIVVKNNKYNGIKEDGTFISETWFDYLGMFDNNGYARVMLNGKHNLIDEDGDYFFNEWFDQPLSLDISKYENEISRLVDIFFENKYAD